MLLHLVPIYSLMKLSLLACYWRCDLSTGYSRLTKTKSTTPLYHRYEMNSYCIPLASLPVSLFCYKSSSFAFNKLKNFRQVLDNSLQALLRDFIKFQAKSNSRKNKLLTIRMHKPLLLFSHEIRVMLNQFYSKEQEKN